MIPALLYPGFDPVAVQVGPIAIRWYALAYIASLVIAWQVVRHLVLLSPKVADKVQADDFLTWATLGVVLGGRLGYVLFYQPRVYLAEPWKILEVWQGGMSFHGGMLGVALAMVVFCRLRRIPLLGFADRIAAIVPLGLGLGRVANFVNGELWGREAPDWLPWAMRPNPLSSMPLHPSQLYEALLEGFLLLAVTMSLAQSQAVRARFGTLTGVFLMGYGFARIVSEMFRQPDAFLGFLYQGITMGQVLSVPMLLAGLFLILRAKPVAIPAAAPTVRQRARMG